ncbi:MAG: hypothetical protein DI535_00175 [Citrobacter freundii]|nr:MAG: hypothetical protein DI535_00175 [Citrobacter freundii]
MKSPFRIPAALAGAIDQLIEEITGPLQLVQMGLEIVRNPRSSLNNFYNGIKSLNKEKIKQIISSVTGYANYTQGGDRANYQGGRHTVQGAMILFSAVKF